MKVTAWIGRDGYCVDLAASPVPGQTIMVGQTTYRVREVGWWLGSDKGIDAGSGVLVLLHGPHARCEIDPPRYSDDRRPLRS